MGVGERLSVAGQEAHCGVGAVVAVAGRPDRPVRRRAGRRASRTTVAAGARRAVQRRQPADARDGRRDRPQVQPVAPRLGLLPGPAATASGCTARSSRCRPTRSCTSRSTSTTATAGCATRSSRRSRARSAAPMTVDGKTVNPINPEEASHTFVVPQLGVFVPLPGRARRSQEPVRIRALRRRDAHRTITFSFRTGQEGPLPLAVLRALRRGLHRRLRRPDADARLHGRVHRCRLAASAEPTPGEPNHARRFATIWLVASLIATAARDLPARPDPAARATAANRPRARSPTTRCCWRWPRRCCCWS